MDALTVALYSIFGVICSLIGIAAIVLFVTVVERMNPVPHHDFKVNQQIDPQWCVVGNIPGKRRNGPGSRVSRTGTKHFRPGTKVYSLPVQWGDGYQQIKVIGRHRASNQLMAIVIPTKYVTNWHAMIVDDQAVLQRLRGVTSDQDYRWKSKEEVESFVAQLTAGGVETGPPFAP